MDRQREDKLVHRAQQGDTQAFAELVLEHQRFAFNLALRALSDPQEAEDIVQEAFLKAWQALSRFRRQARFQTWLYRIVMNLCYNRLPRLRVEMEQANEEAIDFLESKTREYLLQISRKELGEDQAVEVASALAILNNLRRTSDVITRTIVPLIERKKALGADFSEEGKKELVEYHSKAGKQLERLERVLKEGTKKLAKKIRKRKSRYSDLDFYYR